MNYGVIAAGEGSRLAKEGFSLPKPMVTLHGEMLIDRLLSVFSKYECDGINIIINEQSELLRTHLMSLNITVPLRVITKSTPSSLHSFAELLGSSGGINELCLATTDTVFKESEFVSFIREFIDHPELDGLMAVTTFIDDESPLFVEVDQSDNITAFSDVNINNTEYISGGIYCLRGRSLDMVSASVDRGVNRMRNFQRALLESGARLKAFPFSKIVDVDHVADIRTAELFLLEDSGVGEA